MNWGSMGLLEFHDMLAALERGYWAAASTAALASLWATEVPMRAIVIAAILKKSDTVPTQEQPN